MDQTRMGETALPAPILGSKHIGAPLPKLAWNSYLAVLFAAPCEANLESGQGLGFMLNDASCTSSRLHGR